MMEDDKYVPQTFEELCDFIESIDTFDVRPGSYGWTDELMKSLIRWNEKNGK